MSDAYTPPNRKPDQVGHLDKQPDGTLLLRTRDPWHWQTTFVCTRDAAGGYSVEGWVGEVPEAMRVAGLDD